MMTAVEIERLLGELDTELRGRGVTGELCIYGGAAMCLIYKSRPATKDVDAIFEPTAQLRAAAKTVGDRHKLRADWLNDAVKGFVVEHSTRVFFDFPNLKVFVPDGRYLLAMKCLAARVDTQDKTDVELLIRELGIKRPEEVFDILSSYYPRERIKPATRFFIEELFDR